MVILLTVYSPVNNKNDNYNHISTNTNGWQLSRFCLLSVYVVFKSLSSFMLGEFWFFFNRSAQQQQKNEVL